MDFTPRELRRGEAQRNGRCLSSRDALAGPGAGAPSEEVYDLVRDAGSLEAAEAGKRALEFLWRHRLQELVRERARVLRGGGSER